MSVKVREKFDMTTRPRRRGSIYAVVLAMAILVSLIGLSAVAVGRINLRTASGSSDAAAAELLALSAVEHAVSVVNTEAGWRGRADYLQERYVGPIELGAGAFSWKLQDELDADIRLGGGGIQPVRVHGLGRAGGAVRKYSVQLVPTGPNLLSNPGMEAGVNPFEVDSGNCSLEVTSAAPRNGVRSLVVRNRTGARAGPRQSVMGKLTSGKSYYVEAWVKMSNSPEVPKITLVLEGSGGLLGLGSWEKPVSASPVKEVGLEWTKVGLALNPTWDGTLEKAWWRVETSATTQDFWVDDVKMIESTTTGIPMPMAPARETWRQEQIEITTP